MVLDERVKQWAIQNNHQGYMKNEALINALYAKNNRAKYIDEVMDGQMAELTLAIVNKITNKAVRLCKGCKQKKCNTSSCGNPDSYEDFPSYKFEAGDFKNGLIWINIPPWYDGKIPEENKVYLVKGKIKFFKKKDESTGKEIQASEITEVDALLEDACNNVVQFIKDFNNGSVAKSKFDAFITGHNLGAKVSEIIKRLGLKVTAELVTIG